MTREFHCRSSTDEIGSCVLFRFLPPLPSQEHGGEREATRRSFALRRWTEGGFVAPGSLKSIDITGVRDDKGYSGAISSCSSSQSFLLDFRRAEGVASLKEYVTALSLMASKLPKNSSVVVLTPPRAGSRRATEDDKYLCGALEGFFRSFSKEVGPKGSRVNMVSFDRGGKCSSLWSRSDNIR